MRSSVVKKYVHASRLKYYGSPSFGGCWADESANQPLKRMSAGAHSINFHRRVLASWAASGNKKRKRNEDESKKNKYIEYI
jgi:hypothetical protein